MRRLAALALLLIALPGLGLAETFSDDFNGGSFANDDGTQPWSGPWAVSGDVTLTGTELQLREEDSEARRSADLTGYVDATVTIELRSIGQLEGSDRVALEVSSDGSNWRQLEEWRNDTSTTTFSADITAEISATTTVRLRVTRNTGASDEAWLFEYLEIDATPAVPVTPVPIAEYRLDGTTWSGLPGEVADNTGNGNDAVTVGTVTPTTGYVCGGALIPRNTTAAEQDAIDTGIDVDADIGDRGTIAFWYRSAAAWGGGGERMLFDASVGSKYFYLVLLNSGSLRFGLEDSDDDDFRFDTPTNLFAADTWVHIAATWDAVDGTMQVFVNGGLRDAWTFSPSGGLGPLGTLYLGDNRSGYHPSGTGNSADGVIDEARVYSGVLSAVEIAAVAAETHACPTPALTCFTDDFSRGSLGADWATSSSNGSFGDPVIASGSLRLTDASNSVATAATLLRRFPGADNLVTVEFTYNAYAGSGNGADGVGITFSDGSVTPQPGGYGGSLGYAQRSGFDGFSGGWLGIGIDEFGNFSNPTEGRVGGPGLVRDSISIRGSGSGGTGYPYIAGTASLSPEVDAVASAAPAPGHRYRITLDHSLGGGQAFVTVERDTGSGYTELIAPVDIFAANPGQDPVPTDWILSLTGSTGGQTNVHDIDDLQVCAVDLQPFGTTIDHYRFFHDGTGLTCAPESIVVRACLDADCTQEAGGTVTADLAPSGWVGGAGRSFSSGDTLQLWQTTPGNVTLDVTASNPPLRPFSAARCFVGGVEQPDCDLEFFDSGFAFDVPNHTADTTQGVAIRAVRRDDQTQLCVPSFQNVTRPVSLWAEYLNPTTGTQAVEVAATALGFAAPGTAIPLDFDNNGEAQMDLRYPDVGSLRLYARYEGTGDEAGLVITGQDDFVATPAAFALSIPGNPGAADASGGAFVRAGADFEVSVEARNASGAVTPNYGRETVPETVRLEPSLVAPAGQNNPAMVGAFGVFGEDCTGASAAAGTACGQFNWPEVGIITLLPGIGDADYLGAGDVTGAASGNVGRFIPHRLAVSGNTPLFDHACVAGSFSYAGEPFGFLTDPVLSVTALNVAGGTTLNYGGPFWRLAPDLAARDYANTAAATTATVSRVVDGGPAALAGAADYDGAGTLTVIGDSLRYDKTAAPEGPFDAAVDVLFTAADLTDADGACLDPDDDGVCDGLSLVDIAGTELRWGRLRADNAFGSELIDLSVPVQVEYFDGAAFIPNVADACTAGVTLTLTDADAGDGLLPGETCAWDAGNPGLSGIGCVGAAPAGRVYALPPVAGDLNVWLRASGAGNTGVLDLTVDAPSWLEFDWSGAGPGDPTARVSFGVFSGSTRQIYIRELFGQ
jgi:MSHA biogenesis protein MshQ